MNSADYHDEMNCEHFMEWMTDQYTFACTGWTNNNHSGQCIVPEGQTPSTSDRKNDIQKWLDEHNITYNQTDIKTPLLKRVKQHRSEPLDLIDEAGHRVLRLPVAHCELNPIELAWASVKGYVAKHNKNYNLKVIERLTTDGFEHSTKEMWENFCRHVTMWKMSIMRRMGYWKMQLRR